MHPGAWIQAEKQTGGETAILLPIEVSHPGTELNQQVNLYVDNI